MPSNSETDRRKVNQLGFHPLPQAFGTRTPVRIPVAASLSGLLQDCRQAGSDPPECIVADPPNCLPRALHRTAIRAVSPVKSRLRHLAAKPHRAVEPIS